MRVFLTGATGFIGSHLVPELIAAGHQVIGLTRSDAGAAALARAGAEARRGDVSDLDGLRAAAADAECIVHLAFNHDFSNLKENSENDRRAIEALGALSRRLVIASGTGLAARTGERPATETDGPMASSQFARAATEEAASAVGAIVMRLSQVHDRTHFGRISHHIEIARQKGHVAYVGEGHQRLAAVHVEDAVRLFRLALERGRAGARYHAVAEEGVPMRAIAEALGARLGLPVESIAPASASAYFGSIAALSSLDLAASSELTQQELDWRPSGPGLLADLRA